MKLISVVSGCYNEEDNVELLYEEVKKAFSRLHGYAYEHIFIDNASKDRTVSILKEIAKKDKNIKVIVNTRNFGHIRSPFYGLLQARGDVVVAMASDLQDPPTLIPEFIKKWEEGFKVVAGIKTQSKESAGLFAIRKLYYRLIGKISDIQMVKDFTGFGLYDRAVIDILKTINDPYPYFRGLIADIGYDIAKIEYTQPTRKRGLTKNNFYTYFDLAMLGVTNHSKIPLRLATMFGFVISLLSLMLAVCYFIYKLIYWDSFSLGVAPIVIGLFFFSSVQLFFLGIVGEYVGSIQTQVLKRPLVIEKERINF